MDLLTLSPKAHGECYVVRKNHVRTDVIVHKLHGRQYIARRVPSDEVLAEALTLDGIAHQLQGKV